MADYRQMYAILCVAASKAIDAPSIEARCILQQALDEAEEIYIQTCDENERKPIVLK